MASPRGGRGGTGGRGGRGGTGGQPGTLGEAGKPGEPGRRGKKGDKGDKGDRGKSGARYAAILAPYVAILALFVYGYHGDEARDDQLCSVIEGQHRVEVRALARTYDYLKTEDPRDFGSNLNVAVLRNLPAQERRAATDTAPPFCDEGSIFHGEFGEPEPDPEVPQRPRALKGL